MVYPDDFINKIIQGDALKILRQIPDEVVDTIITSPPYWGLRDYGVKGQIGLEKTPEEYVEKLVNIFREARRVLRKSGTLWLNLGDTYYGGGFGYSDETDEEFAEKYPKQATNRGTVSIETRNKLYKIRSFKHPVLKPKDLVGIPWRVAFALQQDGWYLRQDIIWAKPNPMPESVKDRCTKSHEYIFLLSKSLKYYFDNKAIAEPLSEDTLKRVQYAFNPYKGNIQGAVKSNDQKIFQQHVLSGKKKTRNKRDVWWITTKPFRGAHFATFPENLVEPMILVGCPKDGIVLDPFIGSGTTAVVAKKLGRNYIGIELNPKYVQLAEARINAIQKSLL
jgi:DNA modification methylase